MSMPVGANVNISGIVSNVDYDKKSQSTRFKIYCINIGKKFDAVNSFFCPLRETDSISAECMVGNADVLYVKRPPFVQPAVDRNALITCFMKALREGFVPMARLFSVFSNKAGGDDKVSAYVSDVAQKWSDTRDQSVLMNYDNIDSDKIQKLLTWWHKDRNLRRLYLFGLTNADINACRMTCEEIFNHCIKNPYVLPAISIEKCDAMLYQQNKSPNPTERACGLIVRTIWKNMHSSGWTATPTRSLIKNHPTAGDYYQQMVDSYGVVGDSDCVYLKFPYKVETYLAEYFTKMRLNDPVQYDTPLDEDLISPLGVAFRRDSAKFQNEKLSPDQRKAIQGALDHKICAITGGPGTGKCLDPLTPILLYSGDIVLAKDVKQGMKLMHPENKFTTVLSVTSGQDRMFEIYPEYGMKFTCNEPHILTLKGREPYIQDVDGSRYMVLYTRCGYFLERTFNSRAAAVGFRDSIDEDIFDIPVKDYLKLPPSIQKNISLFHAPVDFEYRHITVTPTDLGTTIVYALKKNEDVEIPRQYLANTAEIRYDLLRTILKTFENRIKYLHYKCQPNVQRDISYLAYSLGFAVKCTSESTDVYGFIDIPYNQYKNIHDKRQRNLCSPFKVRYTHYGKYSGFMLDNDGRFLLADCTVTHNTTCIKEIVYNLDVRGAKYALASFTGKAVARIREVTGSRKASTIHRLIANAKKDPYIKFSKEFEKNKDAQEIDFDYVVIDEASMVTTELLYDFLKAYPNIGHIILIGDTNQLQPIGWGSLFSQLVKSKTIPIYRLNTNFRVYTIDGERDGVILNANAIISLGPGDPPFSYTIENNFRIIQAGSEIYRNTYTGESMEAGKAAVYGKVTEFLHAGIPVGGFVVLCPYNQPIDELNKRIQKIYDKGAPKVVDSRGVIWMVGDVVVLLLNLKDLMIFNGEQGVVKEVNSKSISVDFGVSGVHDFLLEPTLELNGIDKDTTSSRYKYRNRDADKITEEDIDDTDERTVKLLKHAYCMSVHKSQGSEFNFVIVYIPYITNGSFISKNLIYTAITRTKRACYIVMPNIDLFTVASLKNPAYRCDNLAKRLVATLPQLEAYNPTPVDPRREMKDNDIIPDEYTDDAEIPDYAYD